MILCGNLTFISHFLLWFQIWWRMSTMSINTSLYLIRLDWIHLILKIGLNQDFDWTFYVLANPVVFITHRVLRCICHIKLQSAFKRLQKTENKYWLDYRILFVLLCLRCEFKGILWDRRWGSPSIGIFAHTCWICLQKCISDH